MGMFKRYTVYIWILFISFGILYACAQLQQQPAPTPQTGSSPAMIPAPVPPTQVAAASAPQPVGEEYEDPTKIPTPGPPYAKENRNPDVVMKDLPRDAVDAIDFVKSFKDNLIKPRGSLDPNAPEVPPFPFDVEIPAVGAMPNVIFPHFPHTFWLDCANCHPNIFIMKKGSNPISMVKIVNGEFCGRCHGRIAFPISNCTRCHVKPKEG